MTAAATPHSRTFIVKGWHVLLAFLLFFGVDIAVNTVFLVQAYRTYPGEISSTPYEDGVAYNATLREERAQALQGWRLAAGLDPGGRVQVEARDAAGAPLRRLEVAVHLERPATEAGHTTVELREAHPGSYVGRTNPLVGAWDVVVTARDRTGRLARADRRVTLP